MDRILQVVTHMNRGGLESMLINYYRQIDRTQIQFDFLTHRDYDGDFGEEIKQLGGEIYHLPYLNPFSQTYLQALRSFFAQHPEYKVIHIHQDCMSAVILKEAKRAGIPVRIAHSHNSSQDKNLKYPIKLFYRRLIPKYATELMACGQKAGQWMFCGAKFHILNNAIDAARYRFDKTMRQRIREEFQIGNDVLVVGHVGRFCTVKNHKLIIEIFSEISKRQKAALLLVGDGELRKEITEKVKEFGLEDRVIFTGIRGDVPNLLQAMDVFLFPSLYEGLPVTLVEAQAAGLPCVVSNTVSEECRLTELVTMLPLDVEVKGWVDEVQKATKIERKDMLPQIQACNYDIKENAKWLQEFYIDAIRGKEKK